MSFHPMINVYVRQLEEISKRMDSRNKPMAIVGMTNLVKQLKTGSQKSLKETYDTLRGMEGKIATAANKADQPVERKSLQRMEAKKINLDELYEHFSKIIQVMYSDGYLTNEGYGFYDLTQ